MALGTRGTRVTSLAAALIAASGGLVFWAGSAVAAACPTLDSVTHLPTPPAASGVDWSGCNLTGADLNGALLARANLGTANLNAVRSGGVVGTPKFLPANWSVVSGYLAGPTADLTGAALTGADLSQADLASANLTDAVLTGANLNGINLSGAILAGVLSGGIVKPPASLPPHYFTLNGYLVGPAVNLTGVQFNGVSLAGATLTGIILKNANLSGASLTGANLTSADLTGADLTGADLKGATVTGAILTGVTWSNTSCPNGTNSDKHIAGCPSPLDTTAPTATPAVTAGVLGANGWYPSAVTVTWNWADDGTLVPAKCATSRTTSGNGNPVTLQATCSDLAGNLGHASDQVKVDTTSPAVSVTGVTSGGRYVIGKVPAAACGTTDAVSGVATPAVVQVTTTGSNGVGPFTATCSGAVSGAGTKQAAPVSAGYTVLYGLGGFSAPTPNSTLPKSARTIEVKFRLTDATGKNNLRHPRRGARGRAKGAGDIARAGHHSGHRCLRVEQHHLGIRVRHQHAIEGQDRDGQQVHDHGIRGPRRRLRASTRGWQGRQPGNHPFPVTMGVRAGDEAR